jgi:exopolysaccharide biosynthesis predicted pyruvyltransferase EpsI
MTLQNDSCFSEMASKIKTISDGKPCAFFSNPGNLGDALILEGAKKFLLSNSIDYYFVNTRKVIEVNKLLNPKTYWKHWLVNKLGLNFIRTYEQPLSKIIKKYDTAILCGSGGWVSVYPDTMKIAYMLSKYFKNVIIMPTSYGEKIDKLPSNMTCFVRDQGESLENNKTATFCHDTAFFLNAEKEQPIKEVGYHIRTDIESSGHLSIPKNNLDISTLGTELSNPEIMFKEVAKSKIIITDRLHIAIASALLGRETYLFSSRYFKIPAIFKASIENKYKNVNLIFDVKELPRELQWVPNS